MQILRELRSKIDYIRLGYAFPKVVYSSSGGEHKGILVIGPVLPYL